MRYYCNSTGAEYSAGGVLIIYIPRQSPPPSPTISTIHPSSSQSPSSQSPLSQSPSSLSSPSSTTETTRSSPSQPTVSHIPLGENGQQIKCLLFRDVHRKRFGTLGGSIDPEDVYSDKFELAGCDGPILRCSNRECYEESCCMFDFRGLDHPYYIDCVSCAGASAGTCCTRTYIVPVIDDGQFIKRYDYNVSALRYNPNFTRVYKETDCLEIFDLDRNINKCGRKLKPYTLKIIYTLLNSKLNIEQILHRPIRLTSCMRVENGELLHIYTPAHMTMRRYVSPAPLENPDNLGTRVGDDDGENTDTIHSERSTPNSSIPSSDGDTDEKGTNIVHWLLDKSGLHPTVPIK